LSGETADLLLRCASGRVRRRGRWLALRPRVLALAPIACVALIALFAPRLRFDDDLTHLMSLDPELRAEEARVRARVAREDSGRVIWALGSDADEADTRNDAVAARLTAARAAGTIGSSAAARAAGARAPGAQPARARRDSISPTASRPRLREGSERAFAPLVWRLQSRAELPTWPPAPCCRDRVALLSAPIAGRHTIAWRMGPRR
jgi:predicted exporter